MVKILEILLKINNINYDTSLIIFYYYIQNQINNLILSKYDDLPFNVSCNLNKLFCKIYQLKIYNLINYNIMFKKLIFQFVNSYINFLSDYKIMLYNWNDYLDICDKNNLFKINLIYNLLINE